MKRTRAKKALIKIKPCPTCKNTLLDVVDSDTEPKTFSIACSKCSFSLNDQFETQRGAIDFWNGLSRKRGRGSIKKVKREEFNERQEKKNRFFLRRIHIEDCYDTDCLIKELTEALFLRTNDNKIICPTEVIIRSFDPGAKNGHFISSNDKPDA